MIVMASAASNAGLAVMTACDGFAVALSVTGVLLQLQRGIPRPRRCRGKPQSHPRGLTGQNRPLYSAGFAAPALSLVPGGPCGGTGRRARLKIEFRKECWFDSGQGHHSRAKQPTSTPRAFRRGLAAVAPTAASMMGRNAPDALGQQIVTRRRMADITRTEEGGECGTEEASGRADARSGCPSRAQPRGRFFRA